MTEVVTQLIVDSSGAKTGVAEFEAAMKRAKDVAVEGGTATASSFDAAQRKWVQSLGQTDPVIKAQIAMARDLEKQQRVNTEAVKLGIATDAAAAAQLDAVRAKHQANIQAIKEHTGQLTAGEKAMVGFRNATSGVSGQLIALSAGAGPVGTFLGALGPWGLAAAVGIGALAAAFRYVEEESARMGQKAIDLRQFMEVTGLTAAQIGVLKKAGAELGVGGDTVTTAFERLTSQLTEARRASGSLFESVQHLGGGLADDLRHSATEADGINALARAYKAARDEAERATIAKAVFGKGGAGLGPVLGTIADAGGIDALAKSTKLLGEQTDDQTRRWAKMQAEIEDTNKRAKNILAAIFTEEGLKASLLAAQYMERAAQAAAEIGRQKEGLTFWQRFFTTMAENSAGEHGVDPQQLNEITAAFAAQQRLSQALSSSKFGLDRKEIDAWNDLAQAFIGVKAAADPVVKTLKQLQDEAAGDAKLERERIGALGSAVTIDERRVSRLKDINSALRDNKISQADANRAIGAANLDAVIQKESLRIGLLGNLATVSEIVTAKQNQINKANIDGAKISGDLADKIKLVAQVQAESAKLQQQAQFGIFDPNRQIANARREIQTLIDDKAITSADDFAAAWTVITKRLKDASDQAEIARSKLPGLTQFAQDAANINKQLDTFGVAALNDFSSALLDYETATKTGAEATKAFEQAFVRSLLNMINQMLIMKPIADALKQTLSGISSFLGGGSTGTLTGADAQLNAMTFPGFGTGHIGGIVGQLPVQRYVHPAYFDDAPRYHGGGIVGRERPIIAMDDEEVITRNDPRHRWNGGGGNGSSPQFNLKIEDHAGGDHEVQQTRNSSGGIDARVIIRQAVKSDLASGHYDKEMTRFAGGRPNVRRS